MLQDLTVSWSLCLLFPGSFPIYAIGEFVTTRLALIMTTGQNNQNFNKDKRKKQQQQKYYLEHMFNEG